jgi:hypothetical protein
MCHSPPYEVIFNFFVSKMGAWHDKIAVYTQADVAEIIGQHLTGFKYS